MNIDIVIPSYNRTEKLKLCLESIQKARKNLEKGDSAIIHVYFSRIEDLNNMAKIISPSWTLQYKLYEPDFKASQFWNDFLANIGSQGLCYLTDDIEMDKDCLMNAFKVMKEKKYDCVIGLHTTNGSEDKVCKASHGIVGINFILRFANREVFCPDYYCLYVDEELYRYSSELGKFVACYEATITHAHPDFTKKPPDATHVHNRRYKQRDVAVYNQRQVKGLLWGKSCELIGEIE